MSHEMSQRGHATGHEQDRDDAGHVPEQVKPMRVEAWLFSAGVAFFVPVGLVYGWLADWESVGSVGLLLLGGMFALAGGYMWITARRVDPRPEDNPTADIEDRAGEVGVFSPHSWWPLVLGVAATLAFAGIAIGWWMVGIGIVVGVVGLVGQLFEFSRGQHAH